MARIRTVKPEFFHDKQLSKCSPHARLLAIALLQLADCEGRIKNIPMQIHSHAFPWESNVNTPMLLSELESVDFVVLWEFENEDYILIPKFLDHQRLQGKEAQMKSKLPMYDPKTYIKPISQDKGSVSEFPSASRGMTGTGEQGNRGRGTGEEEQGKSKTLVEQKLDEPDDAEQVFRFWQITLNHPKSAYESKRKALIKKSLKNYPKEDLMKAIHGCSVTPFNMGENDSGAVFDKLSLIFKDADQIDRFINNSDNPPTGKNKTIEQFQNENSVRAERIMKSLGMDTNA